MRYGYRYYNPNTERWLIRNPLGEHGGEGLYVFCGNDTETHIDIFGLCANGKRRSRLQAQSAAILVFAPSRERKNFLGCQA
jgi:hypothetical protein